MRIFSLFLVVSSAAAFMVVQHTPTKIFTTLDMVSRKEFFASLAAASLAVPAAANAFSQQLPYYQVEQSQLPTNGKLDLNSAFVGEYKYLRGMFPTTAGKIASNGPYAQVKDVYSIPGLTDHDISNLKKYEKYFTVNPPGRAFYERINARVST